MSIVKPIVLAKDLTDFLTPGVGFRLATQILNTLNQAGYKCYLAGGCVRDSLLGRNYKDIDIVTDALPEQIEALFPGQTIPVGKKFGIIIVHSAGVQVEVATFRKDGDYQDGRRPEQVQFSSEQEDALRRDFTINALFYDFFSQVIIDYVGGIEDIHHKKLRTVGNPEKRFSEDYLRILRLFRFAKVLEFEIDDESLKCALKNLENLSFVSGERKKEELYKSFWGVKDQLELALYYQQLSLWSYYFNLKEMTFRKELFRDYLTEEVELLIVLLWEVASPKGPLTQLKLSHKVFSSVTKALGFKKQWTTLLSLPEADKRKLCLQSEFEMVLNLMLKIQPADSEMLRLLKLCQDYKKKPPQALLRGEDLKSYFQGVELGNALDLVFKEQLVQNWQSKEQALDWVLKSGRIPKSKK